MLTSKPSSTKFVSERDDLNSRFKQLLYDVLHSSAVEYIMALIILGSFGLIIVETNLRAQESDNEVPGWMDVAGWFVLGVFTLEVIGRMYLKRLNFFRDPWNIFDFLIIFTDLIFSLIAEVFSSLLPTSFLRIFRMAKICRISKVFRIFPELRLLIGGLVGAMKAILWGTVLMLTAMLICAVLAVQFIHPLNKKLAEQGVYDGCYDCKDKFASVQNAVLTFWQQIVAGDSWGQVTLPIIHEYPAATLYFAVVFLLLAIALQNLILGVIVDVAQESRKRIQQSTEKEKLVMRMESQTHLAQMCRDMDTDDNGELSKEELFQAYTDNSDFREALHELDVQYGDLDVVWLLLDKDRSGSVDYDEFVTELYNLRSSETQFMMTYIKYYVTIIKDSILDKIQVVETGMKEIETDLTELENLEKRRSIFSNDGCGVDDERNAGNRSRAGTKEAPNASRHDSDEAPMEEGNLNCVMEMPIHHLSERPIHHLSETIFHDLVKEIQQSEHRVTAMLESLDEKVEFSLSEQMQRMRGSLSWSLALPCQSVSNGSEKVVLQTPSNSRRLMQTPTGSRQQTDRVFGIPHNSGTGAPQRSPHERDEGGHRWH